MSCSVPLLRLLHRLLYWSFLQSTRNFHLHLVLLTLLVFCQRGVVAHLLNWIYTGGSLVFALTIVLELVRLCLDGLPSLILRPSVVSVIHSCTLPLQMIFRIVEAATCLRQL